MEPNIVIIVAPTNANMPKHIKNKPGSPSKIENINPKTKKPMTVILITTTQIAAKVPTNIFIKFCVFGDIPAE